VKVDRNGEKMELEVNVKEQNGDMLVTVKGDVDLYTSPRVRSALVKALTKTSGGVGIDLREVTYMDSSGVATLVEALRAAGQKKLDFFLVSPSKPVMKVLELSRLDSVFRIRKDS